LLVVVYCGLVLLALAALREHSPDSWNALLESQ